MITKIMNNKALRSLCLAFCISLISATCFAATYYVDKNNPGASDSNSGTAAGSPFKTIQKGINAAYSGDTVYIKAGTYYETVNLVRSGSAGKPITIKGAPNELVVLDGSQSSDYRVVDWNGRKNYITWDGIDVLNGSKYGIWCEGDYNSILNSRIGNHGVKGQTATGLTAIRTNFVTIRNNEVFNNGWNGISVSTSNNATVEHNISYDNTAHVGIQLMCSPSYEQALMSNNNMRYNIIYNNENGVYLRYQQNNEVRDNLIFNNSMNGIFINKGSTSPVISTWQANTKILNNTIVNNGTNGVNNAVVTNLTIKNNILANNAKFDIASSKTSGHVIDNNLYYSTEKLNWGGTTYYSLSSFQSATKQDANGIVADPLFKNAANMDYALSPESPAIDAGEDLSTEGSSSDIDGSPRPQGAGFDIGAYEFGASSPKITPPKNLRIR